MQTHLFLLHLLLLSIATTVTTGNRRILHQPFFPQDSSPPTQPPPNPPTDQLPFFPTYPSPPPPPPTTAAPTTASSVPANISSLSLPKPPSPKPISKKLIFAAIAAVIAAVCVIAVVILLHIRKRKNQNFTNTHQKPETPSSLSSNTSIPTNPNQRIPPRKSPHTSSEFLYLGTLASTTNNNNNNILPQNDTNINISRKMESPDLQPLPPLKLSGPQPPQQHQNADYSGPFIGDEDDENDEFYSPKGSVGTGSRRTFYEPKNFEEERREMDSTTTSSSSDSGGSPVRSVSLSISPPASLSPKVFSRTKSPELVPLHLTDSSQASSPRASSDSSVDRINNSVPPQPTLGFTAASSSASSSPERYSMKNQSSSPTSSDVSSDQILHSPVRADNFTSFMGAPPPQPPPPPPPLPPARHWESPKTPSNKVVQAVLRPPVLVAPSRPVSLAAPPLISPIEMPQINENSNEETPKLKLKPLHWDKVRASSDRETVWDHLRSSSFKLNEEMMETLFVVNKQTPVPTPRETNWRAVLPSQGQENRVLDPKKSQNVAILLRALNVTIEEVCESLLEGNADNLGTELLESLLKMAPTKEEERKLKEYKDDSPIKLGPGERFLKSMLDIPLAFRRVEAMLYVSNFESEVEYLKNSFETLEAACEELRTSRMFLKLLEAVLKTGNRMNVGTNRGDAQAFKLDTLLKLVDIKGADGKTTLLHFVVQEIIRSEGSRLSNANPNLQPTPADDAKLRKLGLQVVSSISLELTNVKKAASMDSEVLSSDVMKLSRGIGKISEIVQMIEALEADESSRGFSESMKNFVKMAEEEIIRTQAQESVALSLVKEITEYFHGNSAKEEAHPFRIFLVVRDFLTILDRVCKEVGLINERTIVSSAHKFPVPVNPTMPPGFVGFAERRQYNSSSDESSSP